MILVAQTIVLKVEGPDDLFDAADNVTEALVELEESHPALKDSTVSVDKSIMEVTIQVSVAAETLEEAQAIGDSCIRSAIHTSGGFTPGWDSASEPQTVRKNAELVHA